MKRNELTDDDFELKKSLRVLGLYKIFQRCKSYYLRPVCTFSKKSLKPINPYSVGIVFSCQNLTSVDVRINDD